MVDDGGDGGDDDDDDDDEITPIAIVPPPSRFISLQRFEGQNRERGARRQRWCAPCAGAGWRGGCIAQSRKRGGRIVLKTK